MKQNSGERGGGERFRTDQISKRAEARAAHTRTKANIEIAKAIRYAIELNIRREARNGGSKRSAFDSFTWLGSGNIQTQQRICTYVRTYGHHNGARYE